MVMYCISLSPPLSQHVAHVEAVIDFGDEENIEPDVLEEGMYASCECQHASMHLCFPVVREGVKSLIDNIRHHLNDGRRGERLRSGIQLAIVGAPNVGKSSLLNILCELTSTSSVNFLMLHHYSFSQSISLPLFHHPLHSMEQVSVQQL